MWVDADSLDALRAWLSVHLPDRWDEARANADDNPIGFPLWRVQFDGAQRRGDDWRTGCYVTVVSGFTLAAAVEVALERDVAEFVGVVETNPAWIVDTIGSAEAVTMGGDAVYAACRVGLART